MESILKASQTTTQRSLEVLHRTLVSTSLSNSWYFNFSGISILWYSEKLELSLSYKLDTLEYDLPSCT